MRIKQKLRYLTAILLTVMLFVLAESDTDPFEEIERKKGKGLEIESDSNIVKPEEVPTEMRLATLDVFAGCGGPSHGLEQAGVSATKWAIEYEEPAGQAFRQNHTESKTAMAIMEKCGDEDDCIATTEAAELAAKLDENQKSTLPLPGQVDFINGDPPCQGFSGMNRFNYSPWSKVQCEMILAFLSFADYFRPKYFILENVRTFVSHNKGQTFRLTLASPLEMGYQVRFGILEAGAYGVSQSRKRAYTIFLNKFTSSLSFRNSFYQSNTFTLCILTSFLILQHFLIKFM